MLAFPQRIRTLIADDSQLIHAGHLQIQQDQIGLKLFNHLKGPGSIRGRAHHLHGGFDLQATVDCAHCEGRGGVSSGRRIPRNPGGLSQGSMFPIWQQDCLRWVFTVSLLSRI
jgi:hypothetical protein